MEGARGGREEGPEGNYVSTLSTFCSVLPLLAATLIEIRRERKANALAERFAALLIVIASLSSHHKHGVFPTRALLYKSRSVQKLLNLMKKASSC